jgi:hypothetical protein
MAPSPAHRSSADPSPADPSPADPSAAHRPVSRQTSGRRAADRHLPGHDVTGRRLALAALGSLVLSALTAVVLPAAPASAAVGPLRLVAVGDSYASGEGAIGAGWTNALCHRSALAGPEDASVRLSALRPLAFTSLACSGAVTGSLAGAGSAPPSAAQSLLGPGGQLGFVGLPGERIDALSLSIGGNDLGFSSIVKSCMVPAYDCSLDPAVTAPLTAALGSLPTRLAAVAAGIQGPGRVVPGNVRNVFVTAYPDPTTGLGNDRCGSPVSPGFQGLDGVDASEATFASVGVVAPLNAALANLVATANAAGGIHPVWHLVSDIPARFAGHGYCTGVGSPAIWQWFNPRYIATPIDSLTSQADVFGTLHPNDLGQQAIGMALFDAERFLADGLSVSWYPSATPRLNTPFDLVVRALTARGTPAGGATVAVDGVVRGTTGPNGDVSIPGLTLTTIGTHTVTVDLDPYPMSSRPLTVVGYTYRLTSSVTPIPVNRAVTVTMTAADTATGALVPGTFAVSTAPPVTLQSGVATSATFRPAMTSHYDPELRRLVREPVCPTVTFTPVDTAHYSTGSAGFFDC